MGARSAMSARRVPVRRVWVLRRRVAYASPPATRALAGGTKPSICGSASTRRERPNKSPICPWRIDYAADKVRGMVPLLIVSLLVYSLAAGLKLGNLRGRVRVGPASLPNWLVGVAELLAVVSVVMLAAVSPPAAFGGAAALSLAVVLVGKLSPTAGDCGCLGPLSRRWAGAPRALGTFAFIAAGAGLVWSSVASAPPWTGRDVVVGVGWLLVAAASVTASLRWATWLASRAQHIATRVASDPVAPIKPSRRRFLVGAFGAGASLVGTSMLIGRAGAVSTGSAGLGASETTLKNTRGLTADEVLVDAKEDPTFQALLSAAGSEDWQWDYARVVKKYDEIGTYRAVFVPGSGDSLAMWTREAPGAEDSPIGAVLLGARGLELRLFGSTFETGELAADVRAGLSEIPPAALVLAFAGELAPDSVFAAGTEIICTSGSIKERIDCLLTKACIISCMLACLVAVAACKVVCTPFAVGPPPFSQVAYFVCLINCGLLGISCKANCTERC